MINNINIDPVACFAGAGMRSLTITPSTGTPKQKMITPLSKTTKSKPSSEIQGITGEDENETTHKTNQDFIDSLAKLVSFTLSIDH